MYNEQKADGVLTRENQNANKEREGLKLRFTVTKKRKLREVVRKRGKVLLYLYFHPSGLEL